MPLSEALQTILNSIPVVISHDNPKNPEFPPWAPKFPATPTRKISVPGLSNVWLKDESHNPSGTHKDRMAWEMVVTYRQILVALLHSPTLSSTLPSMSIISSGSAAVAIQNMLKRYHLPALKVIVDVSTDAKIQKHLKRIGCEVYVLDLSKQRLEWTDVLRETNNQNGLDITSNEAFDPHTRFYDWLSYEIINENAEFCFVPFGTGALYENLLNVAKTQVSDGKEGKDPGFLGNIDTLRQCRFYGARTSNPLSKAAAKLYSPYLPYAHYNDHWIRYYKMIGCCGEESRVGYFTEEYLEEAIALAADQGIEAEPSALAGLAMLLKMKAKLPSDAKILVVSTGKANLSFSEE